jgi:hypothetical protein
MGSPCGECAGPAGRRSSGAPADVLRAPWRVAPRRRSAGPPRREPSSALIARSRSIESIIFAVIILARRRSSDRTTTCARRSRMGAGPLRAAFCFRMKPSDISASASRTQWATSAAAMRAPTRKTCRGVSSGSRPTALPIRGATTARRRSAGAARGGREEERQRRRWERRKLLPLHRNRPTVGRPWAVAVRQLAS